LDSGGGGIHEEEKLPPRLLKPGIGRAFFAPIKKTPGRNDRAFV
jgi:hypothetical protein